MKTKLPFPILVLFLNSIAEKIKETVKVMRVNNWDTDKECHFNFLLSVSEKLDSLVELFSNTSQVLV